MATVDLVPYNCAGHQHLAPLHSGTLPATGLPSVVDTGKNGCIVKSESKSERLGMHLHSENEMTHKQSVKVWLEGVLDSADEP
jgi:hypothetical protein